MIRTVQRNIKETEKEPVNHLVWQRANGKENSNP